MAHARLRSARERRGASPRARWSDSESAFFEEAPTHVQLPRAEAPTVIPSVLRGVARLSRRVPSGVVFLPARRPLRHVLWLLGTAVGMALLPTAAALACYLVGTYTPRGQAGLHLLGAGIMAAVCAGVAGVLVSWSDYARQRWALMRLEGLYLLPDAVVAWCGPQATRIPRALLTEVRFQRRGGAGARTCHLSWRRPGLGAAQTLVIGEDFGAFSEQDVIRLSAWLYATGPRGGRDPFR